MLELKLTHDGKRVPVNQTLFPMADDISKDIAQKWLRDFTHVNRLDTWDKDLPKNNIICITTTSANSRY